MGEETLRLRQDVETPPGRVIDVVVWGASRPHLLQRTLDSFRAHATFSTGRLRWFLEDGAFDAARAAESAALAEGFGFDGIHVEHVGSYGWAMTHAMDRWVRAPLMFSLEDDWLCLRDLDLDLAFDVFEQHAHVNQLRFNRRKNSRSQNDGAVVFAERTLDVGGQPLPFLSSPHWVFNPALWRMSYIRPRWKGYCNNVHIWTNREAPIGLLPPGPRPSQDWYADVLGTLIWGGVGEPAFFEHIGSGAESIHKAQGRV